MTDTLVQQIASQLGRLRARWQRWVVVDMFRLLSLALLIIVAFSFIADWGFTYWHLDWVSRLLLGLVYLAILGGILIWRGVIPLMHPPSDRSLLLKLEAHDPQLADRLITGWSFAHTSTPDDVEQSPDLRHHAIASATQRIAEVDFNAVLDRPRYHKNLQQLAMIHGSWLAGLLLLVILTATGIASPWGTLGTWFERNFMLAETAWPRRTTLVVQGFGDDQRKTLAEGDDMTLRVEALGRIPRNVQAELVDADGERETILLAGVGDNRFATTIRQLLNPLQLRLNGGDHTTDWYTIDLVARPNLAAMNLHATPPPYTAEPARDLPAAQGAYTLNQGATLRIEARFDKPLNHAAVRMSQGPAIAMQLSEDRRTATGRLTGEQIQPGTLRLIIEDADGLSPTAPPGFALRILPDHPPSVRAKLAGVGTMIVANARVPIELEIEDDHHVATLHAELQRHRMQTQQASMDPMNIDIELPADEAEHRKQLDQRIELEADSWQVEPGDHVSLIFHSTDNRHQRDPQSGQWSADPQAASSNTLAWRIVTAAQLRKDLLRRQQEQRFAFDRMIRDQQSIIEETQVLIATLNTPEQWSLSATRQLQRLIRQQRMMTNRVRASAQAHRAIVDEVIYNRLETEQGPIRQRVPRLIIEPLYELAEPDGLIDRSARMLDRAQMLDPQAYDQLQQQLRLAEQAEVRLLNDLRVIRTAMVKMQGYQEAVNLMREVLRMQEQVHQQSVEEMEKMLEQEFFEDDS